MNRTIKQAGEPTCRNSGAAAAMVGYELWGLSTQVLFPVATIWTLVPDLRSACTHPQETSAGRCRELGRPSTAPR